jgi:peptidoglycan/LPS O-acetylase OafA/YrhL
LKFLNQLSRITTSGKVFIPQIDGLRFVAIIAVVAFHVRAICSSHFRASPAGHTIDGDLVNNVFGAGCFGVQFLFVISGFILSLPFARQYLCQGRRISLRGFYVRRVTRMQPPYAIHLAFLLALCWLVLRWQPSHPHLYHNPAWADYALKHILSSFFYLNGLIFGTHPYPNIALWALEIEVQFYLLAPFLVGIFRIADTWKRRTFIVISILTGCLMVFLVNALAGLSNANSYRICYSLIGNYQYFLMGFLLADLYLLNRLESSVRNYQWDLVFPLAMTAVVLLRHSSLLGIMLPWMVLVSCLAAFRGTLTARFLSHPWITTMGGMCYTIYLYHRLMISMLVRVTGRLRTHILWLDLLIQFILMSVIIIAACAVLFTLFERPFMQSDWPARVWKKIRPAGKADAS